RCCAARGTRCSPALLLVLVVAQAPRRPVVLGSVAAARAVQRGDVLEWHEDVPVQLDVGDVLDVAVGCQYALLVLAPEERDLDLLALVLAGVVLHRSGQSSRSS